MRDLDIRRLLRRQLADAFGCDSSTLILEEFGICCGKARVDMAVVNGELKGFEIKSDQDTLVRLHSQASAYGRVFDTVSIVVSPRHLRRARRVLPDWWGIIVAEYSEGDHLGFQCVRREKVNKAQDPLSLAQLLWRDEALSFLQMHGLARGLKSRPRRVLWDVLSASLPLTDLRELVRAQLKKRRDWPVAALHRRYDGKCRPSARLSDSRS